MSNDQLAPVGNAQAAGIGVSILRQVHRHLVRRALCVLEDGTCQGGRLLVST